MAVGIASKALRALLSQFGGTRVFTGRDSVGIGLQSNVRGEIIKLDKLSRTHQRIIARSLNKAIMAARTQTRRELAGVKGIPQKVLQRRVAAYKATPKRPKAALWIGTRKAITAKEVGGALRTGAGGTVRVGRRVFTGAFRARMPGGHVGIFTRKPEATHRRRADGQSTQLPIQESLVQLMPEARDISRGAVRFHQKNTFPKELKRLARLELEKKRL